MKPSVSELGVQYSFELEQRINATPFLKWAGGKGQLLQTLLEYLPNELKNGEIKKYCEPFIGGGAVFFYVVQNFNIEQAYISDINDDLIDVYMAIKNQVEEIIYQLQIIKNSFYSLLNDKRKDFYYQTREEFNNNKGKFKKYTSNSIHRLAQLIFMNRTCFNGLFRTNSNGIFNVPYGQYKNPKIYDENNLRAISYCLQKTIIECGDFEKSESFIDEKTLVYFDPPYRPISKTSHFTSYFPGGFDDNEQIRLSKFYKKLDSKKAYLIMSNSDSFDTENRDDFFEGIYSDYKIRKVKAYRAINCISSKRGKITENIITNYDL